MSSSRTSRSLGRKSRRFSPTKLTSNIGNQINAKKNSKK